MGRYIPPALRNKPADNSASDENTNNNETTEAPSRSLASLSMNSDTADKSTNIARYTVDEIHAYYLKDGKGFEQKPGQFQPCSRSTLNDSVDSPKTLAYVMLFPGAHPKWDSESLVYAKSNLHLLPGNDALTDSETVEQPQDVRNENVEEPKPLRFSSNANILMDSAMVFAPKTLPSISEQISGLDQESEQQHQETTTAGSGTHSRVLSEESSSDGGVHLAPDSTTDEKVQPQPSNQPDQSEDLNHQASTEHASKDPSKAAAIPILPGSPGSPVTITDNVLLDSHQPIAVFSQPRRGHRNIEFIGYYKLKSITYLPPGSHELVAMLEVKFGGPPSPENPDSTSNQAATDQSTAENTTTAKTDSITEPKPDSTTPPPTTRDLPISNRGFSRPRGGKHSGPAHRSAEAWQKSLSVTWAVIALTPLDAASPSASLDDTSVSTNPDTEHTVTSVAEKLAPPAIETHTENDTPYYGRPRGQNARRGWQTFRGRSSYREGRREARREPRPGDGESEKAGDEDSEFIEKGGVAVPKEHKWVGGRAE